MTFNQIQTLTEDEVCLALYIVNVIANPGVPKMEFEPRHLTWFRKGMLEQKILSAFPSLLPEGHVTYTSLLSKLGIQVNIKYEVEKSGISAPEPNPPVTGSYETSGSIYYN